MFVSFLDRTVAFALMSLALTVSFATATAGVL